MYALDGGLASIGEARQIAFSFLAGAEPPVTPATSVDVLLAVSELVTNAVRHAPGPCTLELEVDQAGVRVAVSDADHSTAPAPSRPRLIGQGGLGLHLLAAIAGAVRTRLHPDGKTVSVLVAHR